MYRWISRSSVVFAGSECCTVPRTASRVLQARASVSVPSACHSSGGVEEGERVVFYRWPTMRHFRYISRFKVYQVSTMLLLLVPVSRWFASGELGLKQFALAWTAAAGTTAVLAVLSVAFSRVAGEMSYLPRSDCLCVSTLTFMGNRRQLEFPLRTVVPFADSQTSGSALQRLEVEGSRTVLVYSLRHGHILDSELMNKALKM